MHEKINFIMNGGMYCVVRESKSDRSGKLKSEETFSNIRFLFQCLSKSNRPIFGCFSLLSVWSSVWGCTTTTESEACLRK